METENGSVKPKIIVVSKSFDNKISLAKMLISLYFTTVSHKCSEMDKTIMAYYLVHGINRACDNIIIKENLSHLETLIARQTIYNSRNFLKREGILKYNDVGAVHYFEQPFNLDLSGDSISYAVKLTHENNRRN